MSISKGIQENERTASSSSVHTHIHMSCVQVGSSTVTSDAKTSQNVGQHLEAKREDTSAATIWPVVDRRILHFYGRCVVRPRPPHSTRELNDRDGFRTETRPAFFRIYGNSGRTRSRCQNCVIVWFGARRAHSWLLKWAVGRSEL